MTKEDIIVYYEIATDIAEDNNIKPTDRGYDYFILGVIKSLVDGENRNK